jgi:hypothetical protein
MSKLMFVTMGTSLFHSASWEPREGKLPCVIPDYDEWLNGRPPGGEEPAPRESPEARLRSPHSGSIRNALQGALHPRNGKSWAEFLPPELLAGSPAEPMRYGAELATILKMHEDVNRISPVSLRDFLASYSRIRIISDSDASDLSATAAAHLVAYLNRVANADLAEALTIAGLSSTEPGRLLGTQDEKGALEKLAEEIRAVIRDRREQPESVDLVISGGYKLYGVALTHLAELGVERRKELRLPSFRLLYIHERGDDLMIYSGGRFVVAGRSYRNSFYDSGEQGT